MAVNRVWAIVGGGGIAVAILAGVLLMQPREPKAYTAPGLGEVTARNLARDGFKVLPEVLVTVYAAFGETAEAAIYDKLAEVSDGPALEALYLERVGAMAGGGLENADQEIHKLELLAMTAATKGDSVEIDATWRVLGTVGHAEHMHMRGNAYTADLVFEPVEAAWKITGFNLRDVDRTNAGQLIEAPEADAQNSDAQTTEASNE